MTAAHKEWVATVQRIQGEAAGAITLSIVMVDDMPALRGFAAAGDPQACQIVQAIHQSLIGIIQAPRGQRRECAACTQPLRGDRFNFAIAIPRCDSPSAGLALAICTSCATTTDAVQEKAMAALAPIWRDLRPIAITHPVGGHA